MTPSTLCIEYCRGSSEHHKYVLIVEEKCTCATEISFETRGEPFYSPESPKWPLEKCSLSSSNTMIGNSENDAAALYNIEYARQLDSSKLSSTTCRVFEHEMFYTLSGIDRFALQSEIGKPILRASCNYKESKICLQPLLHDKDASTFASVPHNQLYGNKYKTASKTKLNHKENLAYLHTCTESEFEELSEGNGYYNLKICMLFKCKKFLLIHNMAFWVMEFQDQGYKIRKVFA